ncbi:hypothetical protein [Bradyrhizobium zhanjiangense]|uniref:Uncharacterized protein n=1 Tax=Bradyrhizobium zhanjiangense TaxID=1325107 RepID=A0A4Q0SJK3_9BRAD|nr:hypothetical protein [Bradyrhizobium zhanjiangense]RXH39352.1 hypothetical protein XH94_18855 [Bradyrhizobium zhanjiangense]
MNQPDIELSDAESVLLAQIDFDWDTRRHDPEGFGRNSENVAQLILALMARNAIPEHRLKYFNDPAYRTGRIKGSRRDLYLRNRNTDEDILRSYSFLKEARYFVCGPDLPAEAMTEFRNAAIRCGNVGPSDSIELANLARRQVRTHALLSHEVADEYFKLALDCGIWVGHALHVEERIRKMR